MGYSVSSGEKARYFSRLAELIGQTVQAIGDTTADVEAIAQAVAYKPVDTAYNVVADMGGQFNHCLRQTTKAAIEMLEPLASDRRNGDEIAADYRKALADLQAISIQNDPPMRQLSGGRDDRWDASMQPQFEEAVIKALGPRRVYIDELGSISRTEDEEFQATIRDIIGDANETFANSCVALYKQLNEALEVLGIDLSAMMKEINDAARANMSSVDVVKPSRDIENI